MSNDNRISAVLSNQDVEQIRNSITAIRQLLPFLLTMTADERRTLSRLGDKSVGFEEKNSVYQHTHPTFMPGYVKLEEVDKDRALRLQLAPVMADLATLSEAVSDSFDIIGSEIWRADLAYYSNVQEATRRGAPGAKAIFDDLSARFPRVGRPSAKPPAPSLAASQSA